MADPEMTSAIDEVVLANRILANEGVLDAFGHVSVRCPTNPDSFHLSCSASPAQVEAAGMMRFDFDGQVIEGTGTPYLERVLHAAIYATHPDVQCVVHHHSPDVLPFACSDEALVPVCHLGAMTGAQVPVWDSHDGFGDTDLLVADMAMARSMADALGQSNALLLKRHGTVCTGPDIRQAVFDTICMRDNAKLLLACRVLGSISTLSPGEIERARARHQGGGPVERAWNYWVGRLPPKARST